MKNKNLERRLDISSKFVEMGKSLIKEGKDNEDYTITQSGSFMLLLAGLIINEEDTFEFAQLCSMFSSKKILDGLNFSKSDLTEFLNKKSENETYEDFIKRMRGLMEGE